MIQERIPVQLPITNQEESVQERLKRITGFDIYQCQFCKKGQIHTVEVLPRIRSPGKFPQPKAKNSII